jgi:hypothetical protein
LKDMKFRQEVLCEFLGSSDTLISGAKLSQLAMQQPIYQEETGWKVYMHPQENHSYIICVDPSRGLDRDASAFWVVDITEIPYRCVARFHSHTISPIILPNIIYNAAMKYNHAFVLIEINDNGQQVADILHYDLEYENVFKLETSAKTGPKIAGGYKKSMRLGLRMTESVKRIGCLNLKTLVEQDKLIITDFETISELSTFTQQLQTYKAEEGYHDDLVMTLVMFAWLVTQKYFREAQGRGGNIREAIETDQTAITEDDIVPFGIIDTGIDQGFSIEDGDLWLNTRSMDPQELQHALQEFSKRAHGL